MKQKDGYVLIYVMVVIVLLCTLAAIACSISLQNLKAQNASLERTQDLYTAEGLVEQFVGQVQQYKYSGDSGDTEYDSQGEAYQAAQKAADEAFESWRNAMNPRAEKWETDKVTEDEQTGTYTKVFKATIETVGGSIRLQAEMEITFQVGVTVTKVEKSSDNPEPEEPKEPEGSEDPEDPEESPKYSYSYTASVVPPIKYVTYETSSAGETTDGGETP